MTKSLSTLLAILLLGLMSTVAFLSSRNDSATFDETAHIGAAYSYVAKKDMRLNPEHPPLVKDLAGLPLLSLHLSFPTDTEAWNTEVNGQWKQGSILLYESGNDADKILAYSRAPIMALAFLFGLLLFWWVRSLYGARVALLTTWLYAFSPTIIAHSRFVTTDIAAAFGFFIGIASYIRFLQRPTARRLVAAGVLFGIAQVLKFSLFLLVPIYGVLMVSWLLVQDELYDTIVPKNERARQLAKRAARLLLQTVFIGAIGVAVIWIVYIWHIWGYPQTKQYSDAETLIRTFRSAPLVQLDLALTRNRFTRPLGQYLLGLMMVTQRTAGGNSAYFLGEVSSNGWWYYFPTAYLMKETIALHALTLFALYLAIRRTVRAREKSLRAVREWIHDNFAYFAAIFFVAFYWASSIANPLNIGIRHVLPTFPFIFLLVSRQIILWIVGSRTNAPEGTLGMLRAFYERAIAPLPKALVVGAFMSSMAISVAITYPYYLSYYNALSGGTPNGYKYITDSNYDWGQDLKRLRDWMNSHPEETKVYLDYFGDSGGGARDYYLGGRYEGWWSARGLPPSGSLFAISANSRSGNWARYVGGMTIKPEDTYPWLRGLEPFERVGTSIFLYRIP